MKLSDLKNFKVIQPAQGDVAGNNNPLNLKVGAGTTDLISKGLATVGSAAKDGGAFLKFKDPKVATEASSTFLTTSPVYKGLTVDQAMKKWSGGGYGGEIAPSLSGKTIEQLSPLEAQTLVSIMKGRENVKNKPKTLKDIGNFSVVDKTKPPVTPAPKTLGDALTAPKQPGIMDKYAEKVGQEQLAGGNKIISSVEKGAADIQKGRSQAFTAPLSGFGNVLKGVSEGAFGTVVGAAESALAPITPAIQKITDVLASGAMKSNPNLKKAYDVIVPKINEWAKAHPDAATLTSDIANTLLLAVGGEEAIGTKGVLSKPISEVASDVVGTTKSVGKAIGEVNPALTPEAATAMKEYKAKVSGEVDNLATQITQGKTSDVARAKKALSSIDVTGVNSYKDLTNTLNKKIESLSETLDKTLETNSKPKPLSELTSTMKVGDKSISHNFVKDAIGQLKDFYKSTNDPVGAEQIAQIEHKALYQGGLDAKDINDLAKLHGQEMSAYNANGQLASGLTKQAAENTRMGLKTTARDMFGNEVYKQADGEIASLIRTRDLSQKMVEAVTKLQSRIQERSWGELIGRQVGKIVNLFTGGGAKGFVEYLTKRGEGTKLLNALDLDRNLNKNLKSLQDILNNKNLPEKTVERKLQEIIDQSSASNQALKPGETLQRNQDIGIETQQNIENPIKTSSNVNIDKTIPPDQSFSKGEIPPTKTLSEAITKPTGQIKITDPVMYERAKTLSPKFRAIENKAYNYIYKNEDKILADYKAKYGKYINADNFRPFLKEAGYTDGSLAAAVQEPVSYLAKRARTEALNNPGEYVVGTAGGSGVGKTSSAKIIPEIKQLQDNAAMVLDSNFSNIKSARAFIKEAGLKGKEFAGVFTYRDFMDSIENGIVKRMLTNTEEMGRVVPTKIAADNHVGSWDVVKQLVKEDGLNFRFVDNSLGAGNAKLVSLEEMESKIKYTTPEEMKQMADAKIKELYQKHIPFEDAEGNKKYITSAQYKALIEEFFT